MKKITIVFLMVFLLGLSSPVYAALGFFKPSSKLYFLQPVLESARLFFTFSKEEKTDYLLQLTERRVEEMTQKQSTTTVDRYQLNFAKLEKLVTEVKNPEQVVEKIKEVSLRQQEVLAKVYNQVPEEAQAAIINAQENSAKHVERMIESAQTSVKAKEYKDQTVQIRQMERVKNQNRIERVLLEGDSQINPAESVSGELNSERELKSLDSILKGEGQSGNSATMAPAVPVSVQPTVKQQ